jgi:hypothetical protein
MTSAATGKSTWGVGWMTSGRGTVIGVMHDGHAMVPPAVRAGARNSVPQLGHEKARATGKSLGRPAGRGKPAAQSITTEN